VNRELIPSRRFIKALRRLLKKQPKAAPNVEGALLALSEDAFSPQLKTHKLSGDLAGVWACSAGFDLRILFELVDRDGAQAILLLTVGTHDEVY
jgi:mRNA interferase YafQ